MYFFFFHVVGYSSLCLKWSAILSGPVEVYRQISGSDFRRCVIVMQAHGVSLVWINARHSQIHFELGIVVRFSRDSPAAVHKASGLHISEITINLTIYLNLTVDSKPERIDGWRLIADVATHSFKKRKSVPGVYEFSLFKCVTNNALNVYNSIIVPEAGRYIWMVSKVIVWWWDSGGRTPILQCLFYVLILLFLLMH